MLLSEPGRTDYDLSFSLFGFSVRTHPAFFILPILLGRGLIAPGLNPGVGMLLLVAIFFVSILVHELGHALAFRYYGIHSRIVLYWLGGLAIPDGGGNVWARPRGGALNSNQQIIVSLAGPVFGLLLAGLMCALVYACGGQLFLYREFFIPIPIPDFHNTWLADKLAVFMIFYSGIWLNLILNLFNLIPIFPLDGGQIARQLMLKMDPWNGLKNSLILSMAVCILMVVVGLKYDERFLAFFFGYMAWTNFQSLQGVDGRGW